MESFESTNHTMNFEFHLFLVLKKKRPLFLRQTTINTSHWIRLFAAMSYKALKTMEIVPVVPTLWVLEKKDSVTKILKDQWNHWGAGCVTFLITKLPPKDIEINLVEFEKKESINMDFKVKFTNREKDSLTGKEFDKAYVFDNPTKIKNKEKIRLFKIRVNSLSSKFKHAVVQFELVCDGQRAYTPGFYIASKVSSLGDKPVATCISFAEIKKLKSKPTASKMKQVWGGKAPRTQLVKKRKRDTTHSLKKYDEIFESSDDDSDSDTDTEQETYENTKKIATDTSFLRKEMLALKKNMEHIQNSLKDLTSIQQQQQEMMQQQQELLQQQQETFSQCMQSDEAEENDNEILSTFTQNQLFSFNSNSADQFDSLFK